MLSNLLNKFEDGNYPLLGPNIKFLKFWGLILPDEKYKKYFYLFMHISVIVFTATEYIEIWFVKYDMNMVLTNLKITLLATVSVSKITSFLIRQKDWKGILNYVNETDRERRSEEEIGKKEIITKYTRYSRMITFYYLLLMYMTVIIVICQPIYKYYTSEVYRNNVRNGKEKYNEVVSSWVPFNKNTVLGYIFACLIQSYAAIYGGGWITSFDTNAIVTMVFVKSEIEMQIIDGRLIFGTEKEPASVKEAKRRLIRCYDRYSKLIE
ncbi:unnamed protein product [Danaus chrysippus]|uniref:(African queen) hypothetical protein n=1 Tax=Danaus chrysippus TaxID=151541 RepID=A0A8J2VW62_9NEOP|nr:unnamed protein product [Danaus chrysippus]